MVIDLAKGSEVLLVLRLLNKYNSIIGQFYRLSQQNVKMLNNEYSVVGGIKPGRLEMMPNYRTMGPFS